MEEEDVGVEKVGVIEEEASVVEIEVVSDGEVVAEVEELAVGSIAPKGSKVKGETEVVEPNVKAVGAG